MPKFKPYNQDQQMLLPANIKDWVPKDHICFAINDIVDNMDLKSVESAYSENGSSAYNPRMLIKIIFYSYTQGIRSSRKIEKMAIENVIERYLSANQKPDHGTINLFRKNHLKNLEDIFAQIVILGIEMNIINPKDISIDGSVFRANASASRSYDKKKIESVRKRIKEILKEAEKIDKEEDEKYGNKKGYDQMPDRLLDPKTRQEEIKRLKKKLDQLNKAQQEIDKRQGEAKTKEDKSLSRNNVYNITDPDSRLMKLKNNKSCKPAYNGQIASSNQMITAYDLTDENVDTNHLIPMIEKTESITETKVEKLKADSGYFSKSNIEKVKEKEIDAYIPDKRKVLEEEQEKNNEIPEYGRMNFKYDREKDEFICPENKRLPFMEMDRGCKRYICSDCKDCLSKSKCTNGENRYIRVDWKLEEYKLEMRQKLNSPEGKKKYLERLGEVESPFGNIIYNQNAGRFLCRGKPTVKIEFGLSCIAHNLVRISNWVKKNGNNIKEIQSKISSDTLTRLQAAS